MFILLAVAILMPSYANYEGRSISNAIMESVEPLKHQIEKQLLSGEKIEAKQINEKINSIQYLEQKSDGTLIIKATGIGQMIVLIPHKAQNKIAWQCTGGSNKHVAASCRGG